MRLRQTGIRSVTQQPRPHCPLPRTPFSKHSHATFGNASSTSRRSGRLRGGAQPRDLFIGIPSMTHKGNHGTTAMEAEGSINGMANEQGEQITSELSNIYMRKESRGRAANFLKESIEERLRREQSISVESPQACLKTEHRGLPPTGGLSPARRGGKLEKTFKSVP